MEGATISTTDDAASSALSMEEDAASSALPMEEDAASSALPMEEDSATISTEDGASSSSAQPKKKISGSTAREQRLKALRNSLVDPECERCMHPRTARLRHTCEARRRDNPGSYYTPLSREECIALAKEEGIVLEHARIRYNSRRGAARRQAGYSFNYGNPPLHHIASLSEDEVSAARHNMAMPSTSSTEAYLGGEDEDDEEDGEEEEEVDEDEDEQEEESPEGAAAAAVGAAVAAAAAAAAYAAAASSHAGTAAQPEAEEEGEGEEAEAEAEASSSSEVQAMRGLSKCPGGAQRCYEAYCVCNVNATGSSFLSSWTTPEEAALAYGRHAKSAQHVLYEASRKSFLEQRERNRVEKETKKEKERSEKERVREEKRQAADKAREAAAAKAADLKAQREAASSLKRQRQEEERERREAANAAKEQKKAWREQMKSFREEQKRIREQRERDAFVHQQKLFAEARERQRLASEVASAAASSSSSGGAAGEGGVGDGSGSSSSSSSNAWDHLTTEEIVVEVLKHANVNSWGCLGLPPSAPFETVRKRYLFLARRLHPDKAGAENETARRAFEAVEGAYSRCSLAAAADKDQYNYS